MVESRPRERGSIDFRRRRTGISQISEFSAAAEKEVFYSADLSQTEEEEEEWRLSFKVTLSDVVGSRRLPFASCERARKRSLFIISPLFCMYKDASGGSPPFPGHQNPPPSFFKSIFF